jgi:hypothetical protein
MYGRPYDTLRDTSTYVSTSGSPDGGGPEDSLSNAERGINVYIYIDIYSCLYILPLA